MGAIGSFFHTIIYAPLYNALIALVGYLPSHDLGLAVIILTAVVRFILYPLSKRAVQAQKAMKKIAPDIEAIKKQYKDDNEAQSKAIFALYREKNIQPFSGFLLMLVQFPILIGLYWVFAKGGLPKVDVTVLYSFVAAPPTINMEFVGLFNMAGHSVILAALAAITQYIYTRMSLGPRGEDSAIESSLSNDMARTFDLQARYILPGFIGIIGYSIVAAAPLYWTVSNLFMIGQEYLSGRTMKD